jgi:hypothetical protein
MTDITSSPPVHPRDLVSVSANNTSYATATASSGAAAAVVGIGASILSHWNITISPETAAGLTFLLMSAAHYAALWLPKPPPP